MIAVDGYVQMSGKILGRLAFIRGILVAKEDVERLGELVTYRVVKRVLPSTMTHDRSRGPITFRRHISDKRKHCERINALSTYGPSCDRVITVSVLIECVDHTPEIPVGEGSAREVAVHDSSPGLGIRIPKRLPSLPEDRRQFMTAWRHILQVVGRVSWGRNRDLGRIVEIRESTGRRPRIVRTPEIVPLI